MGRSGGVTCYASNCEDEMDLETEPSGLRGLGRIRARQSIEEGLMKPKARSAGNWCKRRDDIEITR